MRIACIFLMLLLATSCRREAALIPFSYEKNIYLKARLNDTIHGNIMFDTGAYGLFLDSMFCRQKQLTPSHTGDADLLLYVQDFDYRIPSFYTIQAKPSFGKQCDGIIGWDLFKDYAVKIDYQKKQLQVSDPADMETKDYVKFPLRLHDNQFFVNMEVAINDELVIRGDYLLDIGFGGSVYFTGESVRNYRLDSLCGKKVEFGLDWGLLEKRHSLGFVSRGKKIRIGEFELQEPTLECSLDQTGVLARGEYIGLLGNRALEHFDVIIDLANKALYLKPNTAYAERMKFTGTGIRFVDRTDIYGALLVSAIDVNSDAHKAGIRSGDRITHFNGKAVSGLSAAEIKTLSTTAGQRLRMTIMRKDSSFTSELEVREFL